LKELRAITNLGLKEAKDLLDNVPSIIKQGVSKEEAEKIKAKLEEVGAKVEIK
jgi:large subunit ribosomal protein L7/L12